MNENMSTFVHRLNENDLREVERYAAAKSTAVLVLFFTDMQGSSALKQRVTEVASEQVFHNAVKKEHDDIVGEVIRRDGSGAIIKDTGDGFFAVFDEPSTAVERALEIQGALHGHPSIAVRIGMDMGKVIVQSLGGVHRDLFGRHVDWASRAMSLADGGHIIVTKAVATDAEGFINKARMRCARHGFYIVKQGEGPLEVFEPYNANITQPMSLLHGEHVEDPTKVGPTALTGAKSSNLLRLPLLKGIRQKRAMALGAGLAFAVLFIIIAVTKPGFRWLGRQNGLVRNLGANDPVTPGVTDTTVYKAHEKAVKEPEQPPPRAEKTAEVVKPPGMGKISIPKLERSALVVVCRQDAQKCTTSQSEGALGYISSSHGVLDVPAGTYKLRLGKQFLENITVEPGQKVVLEQ